MEGEGSRYGAMLASLGALALAVATFLPWYEVAVPVGGTLAPSGPAGGAEAIRVSALPVYEHVTVFGGQHVLRLGSVMLVVLAAMALLDALLAISRGAARGGAGGAVVLLGSLACAWVAYRMLVPPALASDAGPVSLREGAWLALGGSAAMIGGGLLARMRAPDGDSRERIQGAVA